MNNDSPDRKRADEVFDHALDLQGEAREAYLSDACGHDSNLEALVRRLLASCDSDDIAAMATGGAQSGPFAAELESDVDATIPNLVGSTIGRYHLLSELGRGGMAVVYLAERVDADFQQKVALKILQSGIPSAEMLRRFQLERQILAQIRHPGIAQLLDAGTTERGDPYIVMEAVDGQPIDQWCDERRLTIEQRLRLFVSVARAVAHAHRNLVVHRDIKPSNILVTEQGDVKLLDFGIAKLIGDQENTQSVARAMTPAFASPEQIQGTPITTATDVYQLGMLLYTLLTSRWPYGNGSGDGVSLLRAICEANPIRPSSVVQERHTTYVVPGRSKISTAELEGTRRVPLRRLRRELSGDLDTILITTLRKEPERRYASVDRLVMDVERFLDGQTVSARPDTLLYRLSKFYERNTAAALLAIVAILAGISLTTLYTSRLERERDIAAAEAAKANEMADFMRGLFAVSAPTRAKGEAVTARDLLERGAERIEADLAGQPELQAAIETTIGEVYGELAFYEEARTILEGAVATRREYPGPDRLDLAESLFVLGRMCERVRDVEAAAPALTEALNIREAALGPHHRETAMTRDWLGLIAFRNNHLEDAKELLKVAVVDLEAGYGEHSIEVGNCLNHLALVYRDSREIDESIRCFERALVILDKESEPGSPVPAGIRVNYSVAVRYKGDLDTADRLLTEAHPLLVKAFGPNHPNIGVVLTNHANLNREREHFDEAEKQQRQAMAVWSEAFGPDHVKISWCLNNLGLIRREQGDTPAALEFFRQAVALIDSTLGPTSSDVRTPLKNLAAAHLTLGQADVALSLYERVLPVYLETHGEGHAFLGGPLRGVAASWQELDQPAKAVPYWEEAIAVGRDSEGYLVDELVQPLLSLSRCLVDLGRREDAALAVARADSLGGDGSRDLVAKARLELDLP